MNLSPVDGTFEIFWNMNEPHHVQEAVFGVLTLNLINSGTVVFFGVQSLQTQMIRTNTEPFNRFSSTNSGVLNLL